VAQQEPREIASIYDFALGTRRDYDDVSICIYLCATCGADANNDGDFGHGDLCWISGTYRLGGVGSELDLEAFLSRSTCLRSSRPVMTADLPNLARAASRARSA